MAMALVLICSIAASAYTLVFRSGLRSEIPDDFTLTRTTLTYELAPGFTKTMLVSLIDIAATERANNQPYGSFFKRHQQTPKNPQSPRASRPAEPLSQSVKTVTNSDLAAFRQRRLESEKAYEKRRLQLGLPTVAESRRLQAAEEADLRAELRERSIADKEEERYWRTRARELRTEIAALNNQINYVRGRLNEVNETSSWTSTYQIWPYYDPWGNGRRRGNRYPQYPNGYPSGSYEHSREAAARERDNLTYRLDDLLVRRAGLASQWQALEDEARDARVPQKWLMP
jgi:hypothetical protein